MRERYIADALADFRGRLRPYHRLDEVEVRAAGEAGVERSLGVLEPPNYFGEIGLLEHRPRTATVTAMTSCKIYRIDGSDLVDALTAAPLTPAALGMAQMRLARTHPSLKLTFGQSES